MSTKPGEDQGFEPQIPGQERLGQAQLYALWLAWHPKFGDITFDFVNDSIHQGSSSDVFYTAYNIPQIALTYSHHCSPNIEYSLGLANYSASGIEEIPIQITQNVVFAGLVLQRSSQTATLLNLRHTETHGSNNNLTPHGALDFSENSVTLEQRWKR